MGLFSSSQPVPAAVTATKPANPIPISQIDTAKWYDGYCAMAGEDRLYEKVRFVGARTFERITEFSSGSFLENDMTRTANYRARSDFTRMCVSLESAHSSQSRTSTLG